MMNERYYAQSYEGVRSFLARVFGWMSFALGVSGFTAFYIGTSAALYKMLMGNIGIVIVLGIVQLILAVVLSAAISSLSRGAAFTLFALYSVLTGVTLSSIFVVYTTASIASTFFVTAGMFGGMALYGAFTKRDLQPLGTFFGLALLGLILAMAINIFVQSAKFDLAISVIAVLIFAGLTAYDLQKIKSFAQRVDTDSDEVANVPLLAALMLYLDFINMFIHLLRLMGDRKQ